MDYRTNCPRCLSLTFHPDLSPRPFTDLSPTFLDRICSIDPPGCTDIDDALHCRTLPNGNFQVRRPPSALICCHSTGDGDIYMHHQSKPCGFCI